LTREIYKLDTLLGKWEKVALKSTKSMLG
jgi:hypothetical protein